MSVTVLGAATPRQFMWHTDKNGVHTLMWSNNLNVIMRQGKKEISAVFKFKGRDADGTGGYKCDGLSVPKPFRWFLKDWDSKNELYNLAGAVHDWLYSSRGAFGAFTRSECDDIFRGLLREAGLNRFHASTADFMVGLFAGNKRHWGNDSLNSRDFCTVTISK